MAESYNRRELLGLGIGLVAGHVARAQPPTEQPPATASARTTPATVILKVDDLRHANGKVHPRWQKLAEFTRSRKVKTSIGIICDSLEGDHPEYISWIKDLHATGLVEFWNHGYDHKQWKEGDKSGDEFKGSTLEFQKEHLAKANGLAKEKLGFTLPAFGAPSNAIDATTVLALKDDPDTKIWFYGNSKEPAGKLVLDRVGSVNIENPIFTPSLEKFVAGYNRYPKREYFVIQGHPGQWDDPKFAQFVAIVDFLTKEGALIMAPSEYAAKIAKSAA